MGLERKVRSWKPILKPKFGGYLEQYVGTSQDDNVNNLCMGLGGETQETMCPQATDKLVKSSQMMGKTYSQLVGGVPTYGGEPVDGLKFVVFLYINMWLRIPFLLSDELQVLLVLVDWLSYHLSEALLAEWISLVKLQDLRGKFT